MTQDNPHNEMPKDTVEALTQELFELTINCKLVPNDIKQALTTAYNKGVEVGKVEAIKLIEKEAAEVYVEMLGAVIDQQGLKVQDYTVMNTAMIQHILTGTIGNLSTRLYKALTPLPEVSL